MRKATSPTSIGLTLRNRPAQVIAAEIVVRAAAVAPVAVEAAVGVVVVDVTVAEEVEVATEVTVVDTAVVAAEVATKTQFAQIRKAGDKFAAFFF